MILENQNSVEKFFKKKKPDVVIVAAAKVGGIKANIENPANFINDNLQIQTNLISSSHTHNVEKLILFWFELHFIKKFKQPIKESQINDRSLEKTNESYAVAKIAGIKMIESFNKQYNEIIFALCL